MTNPYDGGLPSTASPSTRRSTRPKRSSDTPKPTPVSSVSDTAMSTSRGTFSDLGDGAPNRKDMITQSNPHPWMHPQELRYICDKDFPQDLLLQYLCSKAFSIPPREANSTIQVFRVTTRHGTKVVLPRGYRVPLMFVAKFQWDSLKLVLTSQDPQKEWDEYKFDIVHLCRLCERLFVQATEAQKQATATGTKGIDRLWRSATFDRVLTRFYHRWFVSREWSIRKFWEEFDDDEYEGDKLKHDWARWAIKGHKGFTLTKEQIHKGITAQQFMHGLSKNPLGIWIWDESLPISTEEPLDSQPSTGSENPIVVEDQQNSNGVTIAQLEKVFDVRMDSGTPSHNTIEVKRERLEVAGSLPTVNTPEAPSSETGASTVPSISPAVSKSTLSVDVTTSVVDSADRGMQNTGSTSTPLGASTSPIVGQKRRRSPVSTQGRKFQRMIVARKTCLPFTGERFSEKKSSFHRGLQKFRRLNGGLRLENNGFAGDSSDSSSDDSSSSDEDGDDPNDRDYRGPRKPKSKLQLSDSTSKASNTSPVDVVPKIPTTSSPTDTSIASSRNTPVASNEPRSSPVPTMTQDPPSAVVIPSVTSLEPTTPNVTREPELPVLPITEKGTESSSSVPTVAIASSEPSGSTTAATTAQALTSGAEATSSFESGQPALTPLTTELPTPTAPSPPPALPSPLNGVSTFDNSSNSNHEASPALIATNVSLSRDAVTDQVNLPKNDAEISEADAERVSGGVAEENISVPFPAVEIEMDGSASLTIVPPDVVDPDSFVDRHGELPEHSAYAEPSTSSTVDTMPPVIEVLLQGDPSSAPPSASNQVDQMDVDEPVITNDPVMELHEMLASLLSDPKEIKVRRAILLLRGLLIGHQIQSGSILGGGETIRHPFFSSDIRSAFADGEESFVMEEHLELVVKCSSLLSKYVTVYKGRELEERIVELDERLQRELSDRGIVQNLATESDVGNRSPVRVDKEVATMVVEEHSEMQVQEEEQQDIMEDCQVEKLVEIPVEEPIENPVENPDGIMQGPVENPDGIVQELVEQADGIMQDPVTDTLTPEATMVDLSTIAPTTTTTSPDILKIELVSGNIPPATRLMTSMMRNLADLLDCTCGGGINDVKGKARAQDTVATGSSLVGPLLNDLTSMTEEMRKSKEGVESITRPYREEVISLNGQIRTAEEKYRREAELLRQRHREEMESLTGSFLEAEKQKTVEVEGRLPVLEMLELRRRVAALERHTRSVSRLPSQAGSSTRAICEDESDITSIRRPPFHPLGHLFDYENRDLPVPSSDGVITPAGTPIQSASSNAILIDSPLPIKSQRKFQSMHRMSLA